MDLRLIGSILLVAGTSIGAGLLALPVATAAGGFINTSLVLFIIWLVMTIGAFFILEVNLRMPVNSNLVSMAKRSLGHPAQIITWIVSLLLMYSLIAAYMSGGTDITHQLLLTAGDTPRWADTLFFSLVLGFVVVMGVKTVDWANRLLMITKLTTFFILLLIITPHVKTHLLEQGHISHIISSIMVVITSFGFAVIIPSLRVYLKSDAHKLRIAVGIGSLIALACYWLWCMAVQGNIPIQGRLGLETIANSNAPVSGLINGLSARVISPGIIFAVHLFASLSVLTSFLAVSLSLSDFLADGFKIKKQGKGKYIVTLLTFLPPLLIVFTYPGAFIIALKYAGIFCVILLIFLPALMAWKVRQTKGAQASFQFPGGQRMIYVTLIIAVILLIIGISTTL